MFSCLDCLRNLTGVLFLSDYGGIAYLDFCLKLAHSASVPIAVHLDHAVRTDSPYKLQLLAVLFSPGPFMAEPSIHCPCLGCPSSLFKTTDEDIGTSLDFAERGVAFDSIMVDCSHCDTDEENLTVVSAFVSVLL
jgi:fructose-bisphosphate aldolase class II